MNILVAENHFAVEFDIICLSAFSWTQLGHENHLYFIGTLITISATDVPKRASPARERILY
jgi:hypothetical protein